MALIADLQRDHAIWLEHNFPDQTPIDPFLGIVEETGELAHALLKYKQGIRGHAGADPDKYSAELEDALGDLFIFMLSFANSNHLHLEEIILKIWQRVKHRDWVNDPEQGGE